MRVRKRGALEYQRHGAAIFQRTKDRDELSNPDRISENGNGVGRHLPHYRSKEHLTGRRMLEKRNDQLAVAIERRGSSDDGHDAVGASQRKQAFDVLVRHALGQQPERKLGVELGLETGSPAAFIVRKAPG